MRRHKIITVAILALMILQTVLLCNVRVYAAGRFEFTSKASTMRVGEKKKFKVNKKKVVWESSDPDVASVSVKGRVRARRPGDVVISATSGGKTITADLKVTAGYTIGIDPGHQVKGNSATEPIGPGSSTVKPKVSGGTRGVSTGKSEYQLTMEIAQKLKKELEKRNYKVVMTRDTNEVDISNAERAKLLNGECDIAVRIHADGSAASAHGASALYPSASNPYCSAISEQSEKLSRQLLDSYCAATDISNRGLSVRDDLTGTNWSTIPVSLIELGFMTNVFDDEYMSSEKGQEYMVKGLADGIDAYFAN